MNYLLHLYLAGEDHDLQLGGLMGDFIKGPIPASYSGKLAQGLLLHRHIDTLAQNSSHTRQSRQRLHAKFGHARSIIIDIFYDHFLASCWADYSSESLESYSANVYRLLQKNYNQLPAGLQQIAPRMIKANWLVAYQHRLAIAKALQQIATRLSRPIPLSEGIDDLIAHESSLHHDFKAFMAEATDFVKNEFNITLNRVT